jgi:nucleotide-binding universal stress UspA family protein
VIGVDGSDESEGAVEWCAEVAAAAGASVIAVNVQTPLTERNRAGLPDDWLHYVAQQDVTAWAAPIERAGAPLTPVAVRDVRPADGLLEAVGEHEADLLVVGTRGLGGFSGLRVGGTALRLLHRAELPLVVVPTD